MKSRYLVCFAVLCALFCGGLGAVASMEPRGNSLGRNFDAKGMLSNIASSLMARGYNAAGGSQIVSLNLTNLLVLVLLKALIFAAGSLGSGTWKGGFHRSIDGDESVVSDDELVLYMSYLLGPPGENSCLKSTACQKPQETKKYAAAADLLLKSSKMLGIEVDKSYTNTLSDLQEAIMYGMTGNCERFKCGDEIDQAI